MQDMTVQEIANVLGISKEGARKRVKALPPELVYIGNDGKTLMVTEEGVNVIVGTNSVDTKVDTKVGANSVGTNHKNQDATRVRGTNQKRNQTERLVATLENEVAYLKEQIAKKDKQIDDLMDALQTAQKLSAVMNGHRSTPIQIEGDKPRRSFRDLFKK